MVALCLLLSAGGGCVSGEALECAYVARESARNPTPYHQELQPRGLCATRGHGGSVTVQPGHLDDLYFTDGLAEILAPTGWLYVTPTGRTAPVLTFDNGADEFVEGLARTIRGGKIGFIDRQLTEVIPPTWDFAFPFSDGLALVCEGCRSYPVDDEHSERRGGLWGYIDRSGEVVVPIEHEREDLAAPSEAGVETPPDRSP